MIAIFIVVIVGSLNDWQKERQFRKLNDKKEDRGVKVIRDGKEQIINIKVRLIYSVDFDGKALILLPLRMYWSVTLPCSSLVRLFRATVFSSVDTTCVAMNLVLLASRMRSKRYACYELCGWSRN